VPEQQDVELFEFGAQVVFAQVLDQFRLVLREFVVVHGLLEQPNREFVEERLHFVLVLLVFFVLELLEDVFEEFEHAGLEGVYFIEYNFIQHFVEGAHLLFVLLLPACDDSGLGCGVLVVALLVGNGERVDLEGFLVKLLIGVDHVSPLDVGGAGEAEHLLGLCGLFNRLLETDERGREQ